MDKNRIEGTAKKLKGAGKEMLGRLTDNPKLESEGHVEKVSGTIQNAVGVVTDAAKDSLKD